jgi:2-keto-4-pentenoate hydratase
MSAAWDDPRVRRGLETLFRLRSDRLKRGEKSIGWKVAFGAPAIMQRLGITAPLVGFLTERAKIENGGKVAVGGWAKPVAEPEIAVHMGADLAAGANRETVIAAIAGIGPAIELVDLDRPPAPEILESIIAGNIFQRNVVAGPVDRSRRGARIDGLLGRISRNGTEIAQTSALTANTGEPVALVGHVANLLAAFGERLRAGEFIITGSVVPPFPIESNDRTVEFELAPVGSVTVRFARG